jgi:hypothetical protein
MSGKIVERLTAIEVKVEHCEQAVLVLGKSVEAHSSQLQQGIVIMTKHNGILDELKKFLDLNLRDKIIHCEADLKTDRRLIFIIIGSIVSLGLSGFWYLHTLPK